MSALQSLPPINRKVDLSKCNNKDENGNINNMVDLSPLNPTRVWEHKVILEKQKDDNGNPVYASYCFDIDEAYDWFIIQGVQSNKEQRHPFLGRPLTPDELKSLVNRYTIQVYNDLPLSSQFLIYRAQYYDIFSNKYIPCIAVFNPHILSQWVVLIERIEPKIGESKYIPIPVIDLSKEMSFKPIHEDEFKELYDNYE